MKTVYERVTERIITLLQQGDIPWRQPWNAKVGPPRNGVSGRSYRGLNVFLLRCAGFDSPWWFTPRQVNDIGGHIRRGERVSWVHFFKKWIPKDTPAPAEATDPDGTRRPVFIIRAYKVVNLDQCEGPGIDKFRATHPVERPVNHVNDPIAACEEIVAEMPDPPSIRHGGDRACYWPGINQISMPRREAFDSSEHYYATVFHELSHSTGHEGRLNRKTLVAGASFGSPIYSREELGGRRRSAGTGDAHRGV